MDVVLFFCMVTEKQNKTRVRKCYFLNYNIVYKTKLDVNLILPNIGSRDDCLAFRALPVRLHVQGLQGHHATAAALISAASGSKVI